LLTAANNGGIAMDNRPIGIFDSGVGGLTVASRVMSQLPNEKIVYFGDTARVPYGSKSKETVTKFAKQDVRFLLSKNVKAIIIACNTVSSNSLEELKKMFAIPIFGVVRPGAKEAAKITKNSKIGVIATSATVRSDAYKKEILKIKPNAEVFSKACPLFVPLAEEGWADEEITRLTAEKYISELLEKGIDTMVMGCTHYPLLKNCIKKVVGDKIVLVDPAYETSLVAKQYLTKNDMLRDSQKEPKHEFYVSDTTETFDKICYEALHKKYETKEINIESF
jgi:glutamate racemase